MIEHGLLLPLNILGQGRWMSPHEPSVWFVQKNHNQNVELTVYMEDKSSTVTIDSNGLLMFDRDYLFVTKGNLVYRKVNNDILSKLLAFVDTATSEERGQNIHIDLTFLKTNDISFVRERESFEKWFLVAFLKNEEWIQPLCELLRKTECYALVRYLLNNSTNNLNLHEMGKVYGLSYSHFRRLCRTALGGKVKSELCSWRMARCVLEVIVGESDMTTIAHKYGYASSSHFSAEVKHKMGKSPRDLCRRMAK